MRVHRSLLALSTAMLLTVFATGCQRDTTGVQAAREERAANPDGTKMVDRDVLSPQDRDVAFKIEQSHIEEMDLGRMVRDKTNNSDVKDYAKMLVDDHNDSLNKIQDMLKDKNVNQSTTSKAEDQKSQMNTLQGLSGSELDRQYLSMMVQDHQKDLDELRNAEGSVQNPDLKSYIEDLIPVVQKHLDKAEDIQNNMAKAGAR